MLVLFDIDGTLLRSRGIGLRSMERAFLELHGTTVDTSVLSTGGRLDPHLFRELLEQRDIHPDEAALSALGEAYAREMHRAFETENWSHALPGAVAVARAVHEDPDLTSALLTGNIEATARLKLVDAGFEEAWFAFGVWGDEGETRRHLPAVARERHRRMGGSELSPERVVVIGDTPHDIDCARHGGHLVVAVATGACSADELSAHEPDLLLEDLEDGGRLLAWLRSR